MLYWKKLVIGNKENAEQIISICRIQHTEGGYHFHEKNNILIDAGIGHFIISKLWRSKEY